jgi:competence protein ComEA
MEEASRLDAERGAPGAGHESVGDRTDAETGPEVGTTRRVARTAAPLALGSLDPERATAADWERLPGIGPALAARIVADRTARGPFAGAAGLARVRGIGPKTVERLRPYLRDVAADSVPPNAN